jgi:hypothetical protein
LIALDRLPQQGAFADNRLVADQLLERARAHPGGERRRLLQDGAPIGFKDVYAGLR